MQCCDVNHADAGLSRPPANPRYYAMFHYIRIQISMNGSVKKRQLSVARNPKVNWLATKQVISILSSYYLNLSMILSNLIFSLIIRVAAAFFEHVQNCISRSFVRRL